MCTEKIRIEIQHGEGFKIVKQLNNSKLCTFVYADNSRDVNELIRPVY